MHPGRVAGATRHLGAPMGWDAERDGHCGVLSVRDGLTGRLPDMTSAWFPTPEELKRLLAGAPVHLTIVGNVHPPVALSVGQAPDEPASAAPGGEAA